MITHRKGNIRLKPEFLVLEDAQIQGFLLGRDHQSLCGIEIYHSKNRHISIGTNKEKKFSFDIHQLSNQDLMEELPNELNKGQLSANLTREKKLILLKILRKQRPVFAIGEEPSQKMRVNDKELYLDVERPYTPILRRNTNPKSLETSKEIEEHVNELLDPDFIQKIGNTEILEVTTPIKITWHDGRYKLCVDFRGLNKYTKADRYPIPRIPHSVYKLENTKYMTEMDFMRVFHQMGVKTSSMKLLEIISHMGLSEYTRMLFGLTNVLPYLQRIMEIIFEEKILEGCLMVYNDDIII
ncbi:hypothetical protein O181_026130 [Austropuccinia psidii MF-1]|uniref:Reverse transcriptase domain-containing protein n=1 Tax=Austropuccinia psidii MF-1 TaxID=1389203 RepID=A0A9Q3H1V9_9BASI|nr:hypothetical protein [Austropuccinia psidii MF-1]